MDTMSQVLKNFNRYRYLLGELAKKNIKLKYRRSYLGILWTLIEPLLTMIVLSVVFGNLLGRTAQDKAFAGVPFPVYVLTGRLLYSFFSSSCKQCDDQKSVCTEIYVSLVGDFIQLRDFFDLVGGVGRRYAVLYGNRLL